MTQAGQSEDRQAPLLLRAAGVPATVENLLLDEGFIADAQGGWTPLPDDGLLQVEAECVRLHDELAAAIFGSLEAYYAILPSIPEFLITAGLNSESNIGRDDFELLINRLPDADLTHRVLYLNDCRALVSAIQECAKEVRQLTGEFYRVLNLEPLFMPPMKFTSTVGWNTSPTVTLLHAILGFIFIRMHSLLDYSAKIACECERLRSDFSTYPRLASRNILFGDSKKLAVAKAPGTVFEECPEIGEIERVRNLLIHDGLLDDMPKAYEAHDETGAVTERFILMPDGKDRAFDRFKNRRLFYGKEGKINLRLPALVRAVFSREAATVRVIRGLLTSRK